MRPVWTKNLCLAVLALLCIWVYDSKGSLEAQDAEPVLRTTLIAASTSDRQDFQPPAADVRPAEETDQTDAPAGADDGWFAGLATVGITGWLDTKGFSGINWLTIAVCLLRPVAWRLEFRDANGRRIGVEESYLWRLPEEDTKD